MRRKDWEKRFELVVEAYRNQDFEWGRFDCLTFANDIHIAITGDPLVDDWLGGYSNPINARTEYKKMLTKFGEKSIVDGIDRRLDRHHGNIPPIGSLVARPQKENPVIGYSLGTCVGRHFAFLEGSGLYFLQPRGDDICWAIR